MPISLLLARRAAASLLSVAAQRLFPGVLLSGGRETSVGFYYDFIFSFPFVAEQLHLLEEEMRRLIKENKAITTVEMVPKSASALLRHVKQPLLAEQAEDSSDALIHLVRIGEYCDLQSPPFAKSIAEIPAFKLDCSEPLEEGVRIYGLVQESPQAIKDFIKKRRAGDHLIWGEQQRLFKRLASHEILWLPKGVEYRRRLIASVEALYGEKKFNSLQAPYYLSDKERLQAHLQHGRGRSFEWLQRIATQPTDPLAGLLDPSFFLTDRAFISCSGEKILEEIISSLQLLIESTKILGFGYRFVATIQSEKQNWIESLPFPIETVIGEENRIDLLVTDRFGREWISSFLHIEEIGGRYVLTFSIFSALERMIALLLEKDGEALRGKDAL